MEEFVHAHLNKPFMKIVDRVFPNILGEVEKSEAGTMSEVVRPRVSTTIKQPIELTITRFPGLFRFNLTHKTLTKLDEQNLEGKLALTVLFFGLVQS